MERGLVFNIQKYAIQDGPGIRTTVFLKGCPLSCWWCHNPESQSSQPQMVSFEGRCVRCGECRRVCPIEGNEGARCIRCGACVEACPTGSRQMIGQEMTVTEVMEQILKDRIFYEDGGGGVTFSGGEPLAQANFLLAALMACRGQAIHTALDTCGFADRSALLAAADLSDLVLYDLKVMDDVRHVEYTGVSNGTILENLKALGERHRNIWVRIPIVPGLNDSETDIRAAAEFAASVGGVRQVCLLSYHKTGVLKYRRLGQDYPLRGIEPPTGQRMEQLAAGIRDMGLQVTIDG